MNAKHKEHPMPDETIRNPANYYDLCKPFETTDAANEAILAFWKELYELRNKHRLADVHIIVQVPVKDMGDAMVTLHAGSSLNEEPMTAFAYGLASGRRAEDILRLAKKAVAERRKK